MPRNVRNFWIELDVDGSKSRVETGPRSKDGGFTLTINMRSEGDIVKVLELNGFADGGRLSLMVDEMGKNGIDETRAHIQTMR